MSATPEPVTKECLIALLRRAQTILEDLHDEAVQGKVKFTSAHKRNLDEIDCLLADLISVRQLLRFHLPSHWIHSEIVLPINLLVRVRRQ